MSIQEKITIGYKVVLSTKHEIQFDPGELPKVMKAIAENTSVLLKKGLFNPSYYVCIVEDEKRRHEFNEDTRYGDARSQELRAGGMKPLADIFENRKMLPGVDENDVLQIEGGV